jgi:hypothetical protein
MPDEPRVFQATVPTCPTCQQPAGGVHTPDCAAVKPVDMVNHPPHYTATTTIPFECIDVVRDMTFNAGNAVKYVWRADRKNGAEDLRKAQWYLRDAIAHGDPVYIGRTPWQHGARLDVVIRAQNDLHRARFFAAISGRLLGDALEAVDSLLDAAADAGP